MNKYKITQTGPWHIALLEPLAMQLSLDENDLWDSRVARLLRCRGYEVYYPGIPRRTHTRHRIARMAMAPMFPGYMFVRQASFGWERLRTTPGVRCNNSLLRISGTEKFAVLDENEFWRIAEAELMIMDQELNPPPRKLPYAVGDRVLVTGGPFEGRYARIETLDDEQRIAILLDLFGRETRVLTSHDRLALAALAPAVS